MVGAPCPAGSSLGAGGRVLLSSFWEPTAASASGNSAWHTGGNQDRLTEGADERRHFADV